MSERESILEANRAFYRAFESLDIEKMSAVWMRNPRIVCIHPGWRRLVGWGPIMTSWERIFESVFEVKIELGDVEIVTSGDLAVIIVEENLVQRGYDGPARSQVLATNVFERAQDRWWLVSHHGSPVFEPPQSGEPPLQ